MINKNQHHKTRDNLKSITILKYLIATTTILPQITPEEKKMNKIYSSLEAQINLNEQQELKILGIICWVYIYLCILFSYNIPFLGKTIG